MICFWCGKSGGTNKDHVVPRFLIRKNNLVFQPGQNTVRSCYDCNNERAKITGFSGNVSSLVTLLSRYRRKKSLNKVVDRIIRRIEKQKVYIIQLVSKWEKIEQEKVGFSPSAQVDLDTSILY